jgi:group II intron reverse transcriptase/maturase
VALNRGAAGPDNVTVADFAKGAERRLATLREDLRRGRYGPLPPRLFAAPKRAGGVRAIAILSVRDRIVQQALHQALQPLLEPLFPPCSYAYRPGVCAHDALRAVDAYLAQGLSWAAETDIADFFDSVSHRLLLEKLGTAVPDTFALTLVARCLAAGASSPGRGIPQGAATSPLFGNLYLAEFDAHLLAGGWNPVRYGDDMLLLCADRAGAQVALAEAEGFLRSRLELSLKAGKTAVTPLAQGFTFLGYRFTEAGRCPAPEALISVAERLREADPAKAAALARGWTNYFGEAPGEVPPEATETSPTSPLPDPAWTERFLALFGGREDAHARQPHQKRAGRPRFVPCAGPLTVEEVAAHLAGEETLAAYLLRKDGTVGTVVLDVDAVEDSPESREVAVNFARDLWRLCRSVGVPAALEDSGRRGRHLWVLFSAPVPAEKARRLARLLSARAGFPRPGVRVEILPRHTEWPGPELGDAVKLPFGVHPRTGRRCHLLDEDDQPITDPTAALAGVHTLEVAGLEELLRTLSRLGTQPVAGLRQPSLPDTCGQVVAGCSVVRALIERAERTGHLRHTHRLILLYTLGRLGVEGAETIHRIMALCRNYDADICQGFLDRLDPERKPITCARIREWLEEEGETGLCTCPRERHTPLSILPSETVAPPRLIRRREPPPGPTVEDRRLWDAVADDLFAMLDSPRKASDDTSDDESSERDEESKS